MIEVMVNLIAFFVVLFIGTDVLALIFLSLAGLFD